MPRPLPTCLLAVLGAALGGCVMHEAEVRVPPVAGDAHGTAWLGNERRALPAAPPASRSERSQKPVELPVTVYLTQRDGAGGMLRWEGAVRTPLPWWQRFPCDIATDFWPGELVARTAVEASPVLVARRDPAELLAEARAHGYALPASGAAAAPR
ncbi:MAG: hypothetical protein L6R48_17180 [Planctomycetes bacterium]|nr:hypothetical protein [Planctomycetota bacterium]